MTDNEHAALELYRRWYRGDVTVTESFKAVGTLSTLAAAYEKLHDESPIDREWLTSIGFEPVGDWESIGKGAVEWSSRQGICIGYKVFGHIRTRGQINMLLEVIG